MVMENFIWHNPTRIYFGKDQIEHLPDLIRSFGENVLLVYGGGSIKRNGIYDRVQGLLSHCHVIELSGVDPNPRIETVRKGAELCQKHHIDVILAVGGGSVIDCSKVIAAAAKYNGEPWDIVQSPQRIQEALPVITVLTMVASASEMNNKGVISNPETNEKVGTGNDAMYPYASICDPTYTYTVSKYQTACGVADIMSHTFEIYFQKIKGAYIQERYCEGILKCCLNYLPEALKNPNSYEARSNLMWASTNALNGYTRIGHDGGWSCHPMEHPLSAYYDITHGAGLAILTPRWMRYILNDKTVSQFAQLAHNVWEIPYQEDQYAMALEMIQRLYDFYKSSGLPMTFSEVGIHDTAHFEEMAAYAENRTKNAYVPLYKKDVLKIYENCRINGINQ